MRLLAVLLAVVCSSCSSSVGRSKSSGRSSGSSIFSGQSLSRFTPTRRASTSALNISLYCDTSTVTGYWRYGANESTDVSACKSDSGKFGKHKAAAYKQMTNYACPSYRSATYVPTSNCSLLSTSESLNILKYSMNPGAIVFVGDSLMMQQYIAAQCDLNDLSTARSFSLHYNFDQYLRPNIPCEAICLQNATFRLSVRKKFPDPCSGCPEGRLISSTPPHYSSYKMNTQEGVWWMHRLPTDTRVLVISTGAWYNKFQGVQHGSEEYRKTLMLLKPIFRHLIASGVIIIWLTLPLLVDDIDYEVKKGKFGWDEFAANNARAIQAFQSIGVICLDLQLIMLNRKLTDPHISADGLHWCNVGRTGMPTFINQMIFHQTVLTLENDPVLKKLMTSRLPKVPTRDRSSY